MKSKSKAFTLISFYICFLLLNGLTDALRSGTYARKKKRRRGQKGSDPRHGRELKVPKYCRPDRLDYNALLSGTDAYYNTEYAKEWTRVCIRWYLSTSPTLTPLARIHSHLPTAHPSSVPSSNPSTTGKNT